MDLYTFFILLFGLIKICNGEYQYEYECMENINISDDNSILKEEKSFWVEMGWLPTSEGRYKYFKKLNSSLNLNVLEWNPIIQEFYSYIEYNSGMRMEVQTMIDRAIQEYNNTPIESIYQMCAMLNQIITEEPKYSNNASDPLIGVPMAALFADVATQYTGMSLFLLDSPFNDYLTLILNEWMKYLNTSNSFPINNSWLSEDAKKQYNFSLYETDFPYEPYWKSWNSFFTRNYTNGTRPNQGNYNKIQLTNDGTEFQYRYNIQKNDTFWLKDMPYSLVNIFGQKYSEYVDHFVNGSIFQSYLNPFNYHQYQSPVEGIVEESGILEGAYFPQLVWEYNETDPGAGTLSLPWLTEVNARGIFIINTTGFSNIGLVCIVAIGMGEVSSIEFDYHPHRYIEQGAIFGRFKFGGSSIAVITEDLTKYNKNLKYESKFKPDPYINNETITFFVGEIMATVSEI